ncbi:hypothetical protein XAC3810_450039 [Xanthomonas citri pv. citri]|nr:hypothetical protein XAC3810_450039 [Xanthomonas citri pv. citri]CEE42139.1 hypothetical protein XAC902_620036 [Xanthomonas citri pv. citri]CEE42921.1 hypothetical protein XAC2911_500036 [Xanthomonas citri pv. citri]CEE45213.1 hypothetical protein XAC908_660004 [Xanthomonas citri pv. citri]CEE71784.1 hypothetical protein XACS584_800013 [Xanthomonas citri pv. citri]
MPKLRLLAIVRVLATQASCCRLSGRVAQLVEQGIENPRVGGSIPSSATIFQAFVRKASRSSPDLSLSLSLSRLHTRWAVMRVARARADSDLIQHGHRLARWFGFRSCA